MIKVVDVSGKILMIVSIAALIFLVFTQGGKMPIIYSIGVMMVGFLLIAFAAGDLKIRLTKEEKWSYSFYAVMLLWLIAQWFGWI